MIFLLQIIKYDLNLYCYFITLFYMEFFDFFEFIKIMNNIPKSDQIDELCKANENFVYLDNLASQGYFKLLTPIQKYHLFATACAYDSIDIAMLLYKNDIDMEGVKELMLNFMAEVGSNSEYVIFRWIWEKNQIDFSKDEIDNCFIKILKSGNLEFVEWFCSLSCLIDWNDKEIKTRIGSEVLEFTDSVEDYLVAKFICEKYVKNRHHFTTSE
jgi:hypothetical protein